MEGEDGPLVGEKGLAPELGEGGMEEAAFVVEAVVAVLFEEEGTVEIDEAGLGREESCWGHG